MPEIANHNALGEAAQARASEVFYIQLGEGYADFSLGVFQMKPSFIEGLEKEVASDSTLKKFRKILSFPQSTPSECRRERLRRINDPVWRMTYLCCFCKVLESKHPNLAFESQESKLKFYAAAYNLGFHRSEADIRKWMVKPFFPNRGAKRDLAYADVANEFYQILKQNED